MLLTHIKKGETKRVSHLVGSDKTNHFLVSIGCHSGEELTLISMLAGNYIVVMKGSRFALDKKMAQSIVLEA